MILIPFLASIGSVALPLPSSNARTVTATLSVSATVVRPEPRVTTAVERDTLVVRNAETVVVTAEGGIVRRIAPGTVVATPGGSALMMVTLIY